MSAAARLRALTFAIEQQARELRAFAELILRGEVPEREQIARAAGVVTALAHDAGEARGLAGRASEPTTRELVDQLVAEVEGRDEPRDPPGRITPGERPATKASKV